MSKKEMPLQVAHIVNYAPGLSGQYGTVRDLYRAELDLGVNAGILDSMNTQELHGLDGIYPKTLEFGNEADIIAWHHAMHEDWLNEPHRNIVMFLHGTPEFALTTELYKTPVDQPFSMIIGAAKQNAVRAFITMWERHVSIWKSLMPEADIHYVPAWCNLKEWKKPRGRTKKGVIRIGMLDYWRYTREPFGLFMAIDWVRNNTDYKVEVDVWGLTETPNMTWLAAIQELIGDGIVELKGNTQTPMKDIYHKNDLVLTMSSEETRVIRESMACGVPAVVGHSGMKFTDYGIEAVVPELLGKEIVRCYEDLRDNTKDMRSQLREKAEKLFDVTKAAEGVVQVFESVIKKYGTVRKPSFLVSGKRMVASVQDTFDEIDRRLTEGKPVTYLRYGDGQLFLMAGHKGWDHWHHGSTRLKDELIKAFKHQSDDYMVGCVAGQENEGHMRKGLFARFEYDDTLTKVAQEHRPGSTFYNAVAFQYLSVFNPEAVRSFFAKHTRGKKVLLIGNQKITNNFLVRRVLGVTDTFEVPEVDAVDFLKPKIMKKLKRMVGKCDLVLSAAGPASTIIGFRLMKANRRVPFLDIGSLADGLAGVPSHGWIQMTMDTYRPPYRKYYSSEVKVDIVMLTHGQADKTVECVKQLRKNTNNDFRLLWIDNASKPEDIEEVSVVANTLDNAVLLPLTTNKGFSVGVNEGLNLFRQGDADYVVLLNNDVYVTPNWLEDLIRAMEANGLGAIGPLTSEGNPHAIEKIRAVVPTLPSGFDPKRTKEERAAYLQEHFNTKVLDAANMISFFCCVMTRETVEQVGLLDSNIFAYGEDNDYCERMKRCGIRFGIALGTYVHHDHHATSSTFGADWIKEQKLKSSQYLAEKYNGVAANERLGPFWPAEVGEPIAV